jgi:hypothetical protein
MIEIRRRLEIVKALAVARPTGMRDMEWVRTAETFPR